MLPELSCDRTPVIISVDEVPDKNRQQYLTNRSTDWNKFSNFMNADTKLNIHLKTDDEIENAAQNLVYTIHAVTKISTQYHIKIKDLYLKMIYISPLV